MRTVFAFHNSLGRILAASMVVMNVWACSPSSPTAVSLPSPNVSEGPGADVTPRWNAVARNLIVSAKPNQQEALRMFAYLSLAQHEAALVIRNGGSQFAQGNDLTSESTEIFSSEVQSGNSGNRRDHAAQLRGAIAGASFEILMDIFKSNGATIQAALETEATASAQAGEAVDQFQVGLGEGRRVGARITQFARVVELVLASLSSRGSTISIWRGTATFQPGRSSGSVALAGRRCFQCSAR